MSNYGLSIYRYTFDDGSQMEAASDSKTAEDAMNAANSMPAFTRRDTNGKDRIVVSVEAVQ